jgi:HEAT repeat protein
LQKKTLKFTYPSLERLLQDYSRLKSGMLFLPTQNLLPIGTELTLKIVIPEINHTFLVDCAVTQLTGTLPDNPLKEYTGMQFSIIGGSETFITELNLAIKHSGKMPLKPKQTHDVKILSNRTASPGQPAKKSPPKVSQPNDIIKQPIPTKEEKLINKDKASQLSMSWIKKALQQDKGEIEGDQIEKEIKFSSAAEKKDLTPEERRKVEPVGEFIMDLTKAMLRSGYYSPDHPGSQNAKQGLYNRFQGILDDSNEILIANRETREKKDFYIMSILDEPISIKILVGTNRAELFEPKLREYFNRKSLVSFAIKKKISLNHFNRFIDIMCDPRTDDMEQHQVGELLTSQLIENGITDISSNFLEDKLFFKQNLPWRVEMAIQRLAKDLKILPQFAEASEEKLKTMKIDIIKDILRPLKHPDLLKELIINCYVIVENVKRLNLEEIEETLVNAFPIPFLHATSMSIFKDIEEFKGDLEKHLSDPDVAKRYNSMKRILKLIASRMIQENTPRVQNFLEKLYFSKLLTYEELPNAVKYQINTSLMIKDLKSNTEHYKNSIIKSQSPDSGTFLIKWFHRVAPKLIEEKNWPLLLNLLSATDRADMEVTIFPRPQGGSLNPFLSVFSGHTESLAAAYNSPDEIKRQVINDIILKLGSVGIEIYGKVLTESEHQEVRKAAIASLGEKGETALQWARQILDDSTMSWHLHRNALLIMNKTGTKEEKDIQRAAEFLKHNNSRVREEALKTLLTLRPDHSEQFIIETVNDDNEKVRLRALHGLSHLTSFSETSLTKLTRIISSELPSEKSTASAHAQTVSHIIQAISDKLSSENKVLVEKTLLDIIVQLSKDQKWFSRIVKSSMDENVTLILKATVKALKNIGSADAVSSLQGIIKSKNLYANIIKDTLEASEKASR